MPTRAPLSPIPARLRRVLRGCLCVLVAACSESSENRRPDVLVIVVDTLRADRLPFYGHDRDTAPFLSKLAEESVVFERAWSASSWTAPATASIFTSLYPSQHGVTMGLGVYKREREKGVDETLELNRIPDGVETLPTVLKELGYRSYAITDNPNICAQLGFARGFDRLANTDYAGAESVNGTLAQWLDTILSDKPWFVYLHYMDPHAPTHERKPYFQPPSGPGKVALKKAQYDSEIRYLDDFVREACELLEVDDGTIVMFTADHGEELGDHGGTGHSFKLYSELIRVPMFIHHPGVVPVQRRIRANVSNLDLLPTLRSMLGLPPSAQDMGVSLTAAYLEGAVDAERTLFAERTHVVGDSIRDKQVVVHGSTKWIRTLPENEIELFDLERDFAEQRNLASKRTELAEQLRGRWSVFEETAPRWERAATTLQLDPEQVEMLKSLGYVGDDS